MDKILITGASGFVGQHLLGYFKEIGWEVHALSRDKNDSLLSYTWEELDAIPWADYKAVIHLAGLAHDVNTARASDAYFEVNQGLAEQVFTRYNTVAKGIFIYMSSIKVVGDASDAPLVETDACKPDGIYGRSKLVAEESLLKLGSEGKLLIFRPCLIYGKGNKGNLMLLEKLIRYRIPYFFGKFENKRSLLSINNLTYIFHQSMVSSIPPGVYHLSDDTALSTKDLIKQIGSAKGIKPIFINLPKSLCALIADIGTKMNLPINHKVLQKLTGNMVVSNSKIKKYLGRASMPFDTPTEIKKMFC